MLTRSSDPVYAPNLLAELFNSSPLLPASVSAGQFFIRALSGLSENRARLQSAQTSGHTLAA